MKKRIIALNFLFTLLLPGTIAFAQTSAAAERLQEINQQIWTPFLDGVRKNEDALYLNVHSKDFIRLEAERKVFLNFPDYVDDTKKVMQRYKERGVRLVMEARFTERIANDQFASEKGVFRVVMTGKDGDVRRHYTRFHAMCRKENGVWKILTQYLFTENGQVNEEQFQQAVALEDLEPFLFANSQQQIDKDVWIPFLAASNAFDAEGFLAVQSKDLVRIAADASEVFGLDRYQTQIRDGFKRAKERGIQRKSEARFLTRTSSGDLAYETGYFRSQTTLPGGEVRVRYSKFEFVLRKENGRWKIQVDKDSAENGTITEAQFQAATPMQPPK